MRKLIVVVVAAAAALSLAPGRAAASPPVWAGQCGIPAAGPVWAEFGWPTLLPIFGRPGVVLAVTSGTAYPEQARASGAATVYFDLNLKKKAGIPTAPADPGTIAGKAQTEYAFAVQETACRTPVIVENELYGAGTATPWTASNSQYRADVLALLRDLAAQGAHPVLLVNSKPFTGGDALGWWLDVAKYADIVREVYVPATRVWKAGPILGNRLLRQDYRQGLTDFTSIGIPPNRLGVFVSFSAIKGGGGRNGLEPASAWFQVAKWQALAAKTVAAETGAGSLWSWGWQMWSAAEQDPDKAHAACVWLWARSPTLCDAPTMLGPAFNTSLTQGQLALPAGTLCTLARTSTATGPPAGSITVGALRSLQSLTGDRDAAMSALFERLVESTYVTVPASSVLAAEQAVISSSFHGSRSAYSAALRQVHVTATLARTILADELRRAALERRVGAPMPSADDVQTFYSSYPGLSVRLVQASPAPSWLGGSSKGLAVSGVAPESVFTLPLGKKSAIETLAGAVTVKPLGVPFELGAVPLSTARPAITAALRSFARGQAFEQWTIARQHGALDRTTCFQDELPQPAAIDLVQYLPFLRLG